MKERVLSVENLSVAFRLDGGEGGGGCILPVCLFDNGLDFDGITDEKAGLPL